MSVLPKPVKLQNPEGILFLDIETVPEVQQIWRTSYNKAAIREEKYCNTMPDDSSPSQRYRERAALFPEFGKIVCISLWYIRDNDVVVKSYTGQEHELLQKFVRDLSACTSKILGWHNIINFDLPYIIKRLLITWYRIPRNLGFIECKPREVNVVDTMKLWKLMWGTATSLALLCASLGIPSPKQTLSWADVKDVFYGWDDTAEEERMTIIKAYCEADVIATAMCYKKLYPLINYT